MTTHRSCTALLALLAPLALLWDGAVHAQPNGPAPAPRPDRPRHEAPASAPRAVSRRPEGASIYALLARVAESTGKQFVVDPRVRAEVVTVPAIENPTYAQLLSILSVHGYAAIEIGGMVQVVPDAAVRQLGTRILQEDDPSVPDDEVVTRVITLSGTRAPQLVPILRPMMPQWAHLAATAEENKLVITDRYANVRRIARVARLLSGGAAADQGSGGR